MNQTENDPILTEMALRYQAPSETTDIGHRGRAILKHLARGNRVLEIGCGEGTMLPLLGEYFEEVYGLDPVQARIERGKQTYGERYNLTVGNVERLPYPDAYFDTVFWVDVIALVLDLPTALSEIHRVLKPGGLFLTTTPNVASLPRRIKFLFGQFPWTSDGLPADRNRLIDSGTVHYFTFDVLEQVYARFGFGNFQRDGFGKFPAIHGLWPSLLSNGLFLKSRAKHIDMT